MKIHYFLFLVITSFLIISCGDKKVAAKEEAQVETDKVAEALKKQYDAKEVTLGDTTAGEAKYKMTLSNEGEEGPVVQRAKLYDLVMNNHDEVMPRMTEISRIRSTLATAMKSSEGNPETYNKVKKQFDFVEKANRGMWDWMKQFKQPAPSDPQDETMKYLNEQLASINQVKADIEKAITDGDKLIAELQVINVK